jgi:hypothetical protein
MRALFQHTAPLGRSLRVAVLLAATVSMLVTGAVAAKQPAFFCEVPPGDTNVDWRGEPQTTLVELQWFDVDGNMIAQTTVTPTRRMGMTFTQPTPSGAVEFGVSYSDASGVYAVGGMVCQ